jgi:hypothetical protein
MRSSRSPFARTAGAGLAAVALVLCGGTAVAQSRSDFDGDGFDDLAIGIPWDDAGAVASAGAVNVI